MKILAIGNSYSQDGTRYIHEIAAADGVDILTKNLVIGGCSLERHHNNILSGENAYYLEINGKMVAERAISKFFETNEYLRDYLRISYDIRTMQPNTQ